MAKQPGKCIFCEGPGLSKEHIFGKWMLSVIPRDDRGARQWITRTGYGGATNPAPLPGSFRPKKQGDFLNAQLYKVCRPCNHGWMGKLQERAKPILTPLLLGEQPTLAASDQRLIAAWITMVTMVYEFSDPATVAISQAERTTFMNTGEPPANWWIAIGNLKNTHRQIAHTGAVMFSGKRPNPLSEKLNTQVTTGAIGRLIFQAFSSGFTTIDLTGTTTFGLGLTRIWPTAGHPVRTIRPLNESEAERVYTTLRASLDRTFNR